MPLKHIFKTEERPKENFHDVVDLDDEDVQQHVSANLVGTVVESVAFSVFICTLIVINAVVIGLQTEETFVRRLYYYYYYKLQSAIYQGLARP